MPKPKMRLIGLVRSALAAIWRELIEFRFVYPIDAVEEAMRPGSNRYYVYSTSLFRADLSHDVSGVVVCNYRIQGQQYNPVFIAWCALMSLESYCREAKAADMLAFQAQIAWLKSNAVERPDGTTVWQYDFDWQEGRCGFKAPWISAMSQGLGISALVRAYRLTGDESLLSLCKQSAQVFDLDIANGGVRSREGGHVLYEEYPGLPLPRVLDGFLFSLLGLYDLAEETQSPRIRQLFDEGVDGLKWNLSNWDYRGKWSWYGTHGYLCPPPYHRLNGTLMRIVGTLAKDQLLIRHSRKWNPRLLNPLDKVEIYLLFAVTKNLARLRLPRN